MAGAALARVQMSAVSRRRESLCPLPALALFPTDQPGRRSDHGGGRIRVSLGAVAANYRTMRDRIAPAACAAVVKADAYGLGAARIAPALYDAGCRAFFVAHLFEAVDLRRGDSAYYDASMGHNVISLSEEDASVLWVTSLT